MTEVQTWAVYPTWCVYPRVQYFRNRFLSLHQRFERTVGSVQWKVKYYLEAIKDKFESDIEIKVITKSDFPTERFIVDRTSLPDNKQQSPDIDDTETKKSRVYVCYIEGQDVRDPLFIQSLTDVLDVFNKEPPSTESILYIAVKLNDMPLDDECKTLQRNLDEQLSWRPLSWDKSYSVVFVNDHTDLPVAISDYFELQLVEGVSVIAKCLESFIPSEAYRKRDTKNLEVHLKAFSEKSDAPKSIAFIILDMPKPTDTDDWKHELDSLQSLARLIKCQDLLPFYEELLIPPDVYHDILVKGEYESKVGGHLSSSTKNLLLDEKKIAINAGVSAFLNYRYSDIVKAIIEDICPLVKAIEVEYDNRSQICTKMLYEINKYLDQSKFGRQIRGLIEPPYIPRSIRQRVLSIKEVYCIGTIYNQFTVLVDQINDDDRLGEIRLQIDKIMKSHSFDVDVPCVIKKVTKPPIALTSRQYENGDIIRGAITGTVGAFVKDVSGRKYALTCAHLLGDGERPYDVSIKGREDHFTFFAKSSPDLTICFAETPFRLIDISAPKVNDDFEQLCETTIKDEDGLNRTWRILDSYDNSILHCNVFKYGGCSNLTTGIVVSADIELPPPALPVRIVQDPSSYLIMIDNLPGSDESANPFSARGDSGSVVCKTRLVNNVRLMSHGDEPRVTAISMIHCGELHIRGEESDQTISFRLKKGLQLLSEKSGKRFVPS